MENKTITPYWIARDYNGTLWIYYNTCPVLVQGEDDLWDCYDNESKDRKRISDVLFPELSFEDGPKKLKYE